jgi:hypothetical protein
MSPDDLESLLRDCLDEVAHLLAVNQANAPPQRAIISTGLFLLKQKLLCCLEQISPEKPA